MTYCIVQMSDAGRERFMAIGIPFKVAAHSMRNTLQRSAIDGVTYWVHEEPYKLQDFTE